MRLLTPSGGRYFCQTFRATTNKNQSNTATFIKNGKGGVYSEGSAAYCALQDALLRDTERSAFLATVCLVRGLASLRAASGFWTIVCLYYSIFHSAKAISGLHGAWFEHANLWVSAEGRNTGQISLRVNKSKHPSLSGTNIRGTHKQFWEVFYSSTASLRPYLQARDSFAIEPVHSSNSWLIDQRNKYNYNPSHAFFLTGEFISRYDRNDVPRCFPGTIKVFLNVAESLHRIVSDTRRDYRLETDVLEPDWSNISDSVHPLLLDDADQGLQEYIDDKQRSIST